MALVALCCAAATSKAEVPSDARLSEAQTAFEEAEKLVEADRNDEAMLQAEQALKVRAEVLGGTHLDVAASLSQVGSLYLRRRDFQRAEALLRQALGIREAALGPQHLDVAQLLNKLASLYDERGQHRQAEPLFERALAIREAAFGPNHPNIAESLNNLANLYYHQGQYNRSESLHERALAIREAALGPQHRDVAQSLSNLALIYSKQGQYGRAVPLQKRALAIREAALGPRHRSVAQSLSNLANVYEDLGQYSQAVPLHERALAIREAVLGPQHPSVAESLNNLASVYNNLGQYSQAESMLERARALWQAAYGPRHPFVALVLNNLALLYANQGQYSRAEPLFERARALWQATYGPRHIRVATVLKYLVRLHLAQQHVPRALPLLTRALNLSELRLRQEALDFSESRLADFLLFLRSEEDFLYSLVRAYPDNPRVQQLALASALLRKGRSIEEIANTSRTVYLSLGAEERHAFEQLRDLRTQLAALSHQGPGDSSPADHQQRLQSLAIQGDALETQLARSSAPLRALSSLPAPTHIVARVAAALPRGSALIEFVAYSHRPVVPPPGTPSSQVPGEPRYLALVLLPNARIHTVDLGSADAIDSAASAFHDALASNAADWQGAAQALYTLVFRPLRPLLGKARRLFLSPDGQLHLAPFAALHDGQGPLLDSFLFTYLTSGKDLLPRPKDIPSSRSVAVFADPDFGASALSASDSPPSSAPSDMRSRALEGFYSSPRADLTERAWVPLPGTRQEAEAIHQLIPQAQLFLGPEASKQRLLQLPTPGVLHLATHGFFLQDSPAPEGARGLGHVGALSSPTAQYLPDPLLRSGLVLAGAAAPADHAPDNSLVTALELAGLDLWGTELVVLSACETGRGEVKLGQGVYGLRRALVAAGAETVVSSLWKVNDETTRELMQGYYRHLLMGSPRVTALQEAMSEVRQTHPHPYAWAPFIALGRDAPLRSLAPLPWDAPASR